MLIQKTNSSIKKKSPQLMGALTSSTIMAFAGLGDAILYPILPVYADKIGIPLVWVGLLLSINRFVRIVSNTWMANIVNKFGMKKVLIGASCFAVITTAFYGLRLGLVSFVLARIIWGLSYSGLKISTLNYASKIKQNAGFIFGLTQSIKSLGALIALWVGPILVTWFSIENGLFIIAGISSTAIVLSLTLTNEVYKPAQRIRTSHTFLINPINLLIAFLAIAIDGVLVVVLAYLLTNSSISTPQLLTTVATYLLMKRFAMAGISLIGGIVSIKVTPIKLFNLAILCCILALSLIAIDLTIPGITIAFIANAIVVSFSPLIAIDQKELNANSLQIISSVSTWWDLGAGLGAFLGLILIERMGHYYLFLSLSLIITTLFITFIIQNGKRNRAII